jgi:hypothetical protein
MILKSTDDFKSLYNKTSLPTIFITDEKEGIFSFKIHKKIN